MEAEDAGDPGHTAEGREQRHGQLCAGHQPDGHGHSDAEQHLQCTGDDERRTPADAADADIVSAALAEPKIAKLAEGMELVKSIVVRGKLVSLILKPKA